jgi:hypothetical protein
MRLKPNQTVALCGLAAAAFLAWGIVYAGMDLWWDEMDSLTEYTLVDFEATATSYELPNNHILYNLIGNLVTRAWGVRDLFDIMDRVAVLRWLQWLISLGTLLYVFLAGRRISGPAWGALGAVLLASSLPFLNFSMQLRGYALSMFFVAGLIYHGWCRTGQGARRHLVVTALYSFGLVYTMPSNLYFLLGLSLAALWRTATGRPRAAATGPWRPAGLWLPAAVAAGVLLALAAYAPILDQVLHNRFAEARPPGRAFVLAERLPAVLHHLLSYRYLLLLLVAPGLYRAARNRSLPGSRETLTLLALLLLPFVFSFLRYGVPFERTFVHLAPVFALVLAGGAALAVEGRRARPLAAALPAVLAVYALATLVVADHLVQRRLEENLANSVRDQNILANYYQSRSTYRPLDLSRTLARELSGRPGRVLMASELDRVAFTSYLQKLDIPSYTLIRMWEDPKESSGGPYTHAGIFQKASGQSRDLQFLQSWFTMSRPEPGDRLTPVLLHVEAYDPAPRYYLVTGFAGLAERVLRRRQPEIDVERLNPPGGFGLFRLTPLRR